LSSPIDYRHILKQARTQLETTASDNPALEAEVLLANLLNKSRMHLLAWPERTLDIHQQRDYARLISRRLAGEPLAYIIGQRAFWSLSLRVSPAVLIPRPDTELLVERALELLPEHKETTVADLGTGSGAIAIALASERPHCRLLATDRCADALQIARYNCARAGMSQRVDCRQGDWCEAFAADEHFDLIVANPPYIAIGDPHLQRGDLPAEPRQALVSGPDGLTDLRRICACAPAYLKPAGWLLLEHGFAQGHAVRELLRDAGLQQVHTRQDLAGHERVSSARTPKRSDAP
jgi:release factor glutamine methyltransferase